jgi:hypothetical protein
MRTSFLLALAVSCGAGGCGAPVAPSDTALVGTVVRGPVQPVCRVDVPCDSPFSASFTVERGDRVVATFRSDSDGHFEVRLASGRYLVVPGTDAPILAPRSQAKEVTVGSDGKTMVVLHFDTGIR